MTTFDDILERASAGESYLEQHGVKGQKWGVRRSKKQLAKAKLSPSEDAVAAAIYKQQARKAGVSTLSNEQLKELNKRLELEGKYNQWAKNNPTLKKVAVNFIAEELKKEALYKLGGVGKGSIYTAYQTEQARRAKETDKILKEEHKKHADFVKKSDAERARRKSPTAPSGPMAKPSKVYRITTI